MNSLKKILEQTLQLILAALSVNKGNVLQHGHFKLIASVILAP
jgi:hypothetical protein